MNGVWFRCAAAGAILAAAVSLAADGRAGESFNEESCVKNSDGSGYCYGNYGGFHNSSNPDYFFFETDAWSGGVGYYFYTYYSGVSYSCTPGSNYPHVTTYWPQSYPSTGTWFWIQWDSAGTCSSLETEVGSLF